MSACATQKPGEVFIKKDDRIVGLDAGSCKKVKKDDASPQDTVLVCKGGGHSGLKSGEKKAEDIRAHRAEIESRIQRACEKSEGKYEGTLCVLPAKDGVSVQKITVTSKGSGRNFIFRFLDSCSRQPIILPIMFPIYLITLPLMPIIAYENHTISITTRDDTQTYLAEQQRQSEAQARREAEEIERRQRELEAQARWEADRPRREAEERAREAEERARLKAEEAEDRRRQEAEARARREEEARLAKFRKGLKTGDDTFCGPVIETRDNNKMIRISVRVKLQGYATSDEWLKAEEVYPPSYDCWNRNGRLSPY
jgi:hypothetical protein